MTALGIAVGTLVAGRYAVGSRLGAGGMGAVYEAVHVVTGRPCAIKLMLGHTADRQELRERFFRESRALAQIGSEHIVDVLDAGVDDDSGIPFLVMERLHGVDLGRLIADKGPLAASECVLYLWQAAIALDRTHRAAIVHRDLKASNLFLATREDGTTLIKVLDFGVAKMMRFDATSEGGTQAIGTPLYMAPEQFRGDGRISAATDIYALGMLAYLLLVGRHYWREERDRCDNPFAFANVVAGGPSEAPGIRAAACGALLPAAFDAWFVRATARLPENRFSQATEAIAALAEVFGIELPATRSGLSSPKNPPPDALEPVSRDGHTDYIGPVSAPRASIAPRIASGTYEVSSTGQRTEVPLSVSNAGFGPAPRKIRLWLMATAALALLGLVAAGVFTQAAAPAAFLGKAAPRAPHTALPADKPLQAPEPGVAPPLTPADLELLTTQSSQTRRAPPSRRPNGARERAKRGKLAEREPTEAAPAADPPSMVLPEPPEAPRPKSPRDLYRRD